MASSRALEKLQYPWAMSNFIKASHSVKRKLIRGAAVFVTGLIYMPPANAQLGNLLNQLNIPKITQSVAASEGAAALSNDEIIAGLRDALEQGAKTAISTLGREDGFFGNQSVKIPMPDALAKMDSILRGLGQSRYVDEFVLTMNRAAESAIPEASAIVGDAIRNMTVEDANIILNGPDDAATQYFRKVGEKRLVKKIQPIVADATSRTGATKAYKQAVDRAGPAAGLLGDDTLDLDNYVTDRALDGLFLMVAAEEKRIRENPIARSTNLLKKVFGAASP